MSRLPSSSSPNKSRVCIKCAKSEELSRGLVLLNCRKCHQLWHPQCQVPSVPHAIVKKILSDVVKNPRLDVNKNIFMDWKCQACTARQPEVIVLDDDEEEEQEEASFMTTTKSGSGASQFQDVQKMQTGAETVVIELDDSEEEVEERQGQTRTMQLQSERSRTNNDPMPSAQSSNTLPVKRPAPPFIDLAMMQQQPKQKAIVLEKYQTFKPPRDLDSVPSTHGSSSENLTTMAQGLSLFVGRESSSSATLATNSRSSVLGQNDEDDVKLGDIPMVVDSDQEISESSHHHAHPSLRVQPDWLARALQRKVESPSTSLGKRRTNNDRWDSDWRHIRERLSSLDMEAFAGK